MIHSRAQPTANIQMKISDLIKTAEVAISRYENASLALDLAQANYNHRLARCRRLAGDAMALLEEATEG